MRLRILALRAISARQRQLLRRNGVTPKGAYPLAPAQAPDPAPDPPPAPDQAPDLTPVVLITALIEEIGLA
jgi:hypothetical protein